MNIKTVYKKNNKVYITDNSGTWEVCVGSKNNPFLMDKEFTFKRTWLSTDNMCKYGDYESYDDMIIRIRAIMD